MIPLWTTTAFPSNARGAPATKTGILSASASMLLYGAAAPFGDDCIAAMGIAVRSLTIGALPITSFFMGSQAVLGFGCSRPQSSAVDNVALSVLYSAAVVSFTRPLVRLFSDSGNVPEIAVSTCIVFHFFLSSLVLRVS